MTFEQPPLPKQETRGEPMPPLLKALIWVICAALYVGIYIASDVFSENTFSYALGRMMGPIFLALIIWYFVGRRGGRKADMTSPLVIVIALGVALLGQGSKLLENVSGSDTPDLAERYVAIQGYDYRDLTEQETELVEGASQGLEDVAEEYSYQVLTKDGRDIAMVLIMSVNKEAAMTEGFAEEFGLGMGQAADDGVDEVDVAGETGYSAEQLGTPVLGLVDEDDGVVVTLGGITDDNLVDIGEHFVRSF